MNASTASTVFAILASAVVVLGGIAALIRAIWKTAVTLRDNTTATRELSGRMDENTKTVDGRFEQLSDRLLHLDDRLGSVERELGAVRKEQATHGHAN